MKTQKFASGEWIIVEGDIPAYYIYRLLRGKVSYYENGNKLREAEYREGGDPVILGFTSALRDDRHSGASVKAETDIEVEPLSVDAIKGALLHDVSDEIKAEVNQMIKTVVLGNHILSLQRDLAVMRRIPDSKLAIPKNVSPDLHEILLELVRVYKNVADAFGLK